MTGYGQDLETGYVPTFTGMVYGGRCFQRKKGVVLTIEVREDIHTKTRTLGEGAVETLLTFGRVVSENDAIFSPLERLIVGA